VIQPVGKQFGVGGRGGIHALQKSVTPASEPDNCFQKFSAGSVQNKGKVPMPWQPQVFGEGAEDDTRGRVFSPRLLPLFRKLGFNKS
jgi:hypothetical protein